MSPMTAGKNIFLRLIKQNLTHHVCSFIIFILFNSCIEDKIEPLLLGSISGVVVSKASDQPIGEVEITTAPVTGVVFPDAEGIFIIENVPEGEYTIIAEADGYTRESIKVSVLRNSTAEVIIKLAASNIPAPAPRNPLPASGEINQALTVSLNWFVDYINNDSLHYAITVFEGNLIEPLIKTEVLSDTTFLLENLNYNTTYYWQVEVISSTGNVTSGNIWAFSTVPFPDNRILFTSVKDGNYEIYSADQHGDSLLRITNTSNYELKPLFSNDRTSIAFSSNSAIDYHIYTMNMDGSSIRQVTTLPIAGYHNQGIGFSWSPDNGKFVYSHYNKLYRIDKDGTDLTLIATAPENRNFRACHWTAVGNKIVAETIGTAVYHSEIYLMNADGSDTVRIVDDLPGVMESPSFTIDGKQILFTHDISGYESDAGRQLDARIFLLNVETLELTDVSGNKPDGTNDLQPRISPDGAKIIFTNVSNDGTGNKSVWIMDKDGSDRIKIFDNAEMPSWQ